MMTLHPNMSHQNRLLRWLFFAVLSVEILHFQEISDCCLNRIELVDSDGAQISNSGILSIYHNPLRTANPTSSFSSSKNQQSDFLNIHSRRLSILLAHRPSTFFNSTIVTAILSCQHFHARSFSPEDRTDFHS
jgi:hypothetical protein